MTERLYKNREFKAGSYIYCTVCDSLVFIHENTIKCANDYLKKCITAKRHSTSQKNMKKGESVLSLSSDKVNEIFINYSVYSQLGFCTDRIGSDWIQI